MKAIIISGTYPDGSKFRYAMSCEDNDIDVCISSVKEKNTDIENVGVINLYSFNKQN